MTMTNDELLAWLDSAASEMDALGEAAAAIRALEAKVQTLELRTNLLGVMEMEREIAHIRADRDRLAGEVDMYRREWHMMEVERDTLRDVRDRTCAEVARLTSDLTAAKEDAERMDYLESEEAREANARVHRLPYPKSLFRTNMPITRKVIDAARSAGGGA